MEYIIRSVKEDLTSHNGFKWKEKGIVTCDDWFPSPTCGAGLHGLRLQQNDPGTWYTEGKVLVLEVDEKTIINIGDKCKFPKAKVVHCGDMASVTSFLSSKNANIEGMYRRTQFSSDCVKWIGGYKSTLTGGYGSKLTGGSNSTLNGGNGSTLNGGDGSKLTGGSGSKLTGGDGSKLTGGDGSKLTGGSGSKLTGGNNSTLNGGNWSILNGGNYSTLTGGDGSKLTGGSGSTLNGGNDSTLTGGECSTLTGGDYSTLTGGDGSTFSMKWFDGNKYRISIAYVGENGILPDVSYKLNSVGEFLKVSSFTQSTYIKMMKLLEKIKNAFKSKPKVTIPLVSHELQYGHKTYQVQHDEYVNLTNVNVAPCGASGMTKNLAYLKCEAMLKDPRNCGGVEQYDGSCRNKASWTRPNGESYCKLHAKKFTDCVKIGVQ